MLSLSASRAKCHAGASPLERRVRAHLLELVHLGGYVAWTCCLSGTLPAHKPTSQVCNQCNEEPSPEGGTWAWHLSRRQHAAGCDGRSIRATWDFGCACCSARLRRGWWPCWRLGLLRRTRPTGQKKPDGLDGLTPLERGQYFWRQRLW